MTNSEQKIKNAIGETITNLGYQIYDVIVEKEGKDTYLRIFIDSENGISSDDCEKVSRGIDEIIDTNDFIKEAYILEVSSPGIERRIRDDEHLKAAMDKKVEVHLYQKINGEKQIIGTLKSWNEDIIAIKIDNAKESEAKKKTEANEQNKNKNENENENANCNDDENESNNKNAEVKIERKNISSMKTVYDWEEE